MLGKWLYVYKNHQLNIEKQKLDQYIKLCQYQIQKLTSEEKRLKHENGVLRTMNKNLMELGGMGQGEVIKVEVPVAQNVQSKENRKIVALLKENIKVI